MKGFPFEYRPGWKSVQLQSHVFTYTILKIHVWYFVCLEHDDDELIFQYG